MARHNKAKARIKRQDAMAKSRTGPLLHHLTMQQEARNTEGRSLWSSGTQLRHKGMVFVSASEVLPEKNKEDYNWESARELDDSTPAPDINVEEADGLMDHDATSDNPMHNPNDSKENLDETEPRESVSPDLAPPKSPTPPEDSSEDEVVFSGRNKQSFRPIRTGYVSIAPEMTVLPQSRWQKQMHNMQSEDDNYIDMRQPVSRKRQQRGLLQDEEDILADYIANIDPSCEETDTPSDVPEDNSGREQPNPRPNSLHQTKELPLRSGRASPENPNNDLLQDLFDSNESEGEKQNVSTPNSEDDGTSSSSSLDAGEVNNLESDQNSEEDYFHDMDADLEDPKTMKGSLKGRRANYPFASASSFADALELDPYYGFDIMDFDRPSVRNKAKKKQRTLDLMISDSELELELQSAWQNDRQNKKAKKQKRAELRSQGLLGRSKPDLSMKYSSGMGTDDLKSEVRLFLLSSNNSLPLPPMAKQLRKLVHDIANALCLKSKSRGKGSSRFPILYKTSRTPRYTSKTISQVDKTLSKGKFSHRTIKPPGQKNPIKARGGRPGASVSYMDGDVVGASAPEIGAENKGRAMLEKMGWSMGTALGATNKGILLPVAHVVKNSKAGLG